MGKAVYALIAMLILMFAACAKVEPTTSEERVLQEETTAKVGATVSKGCDWKAEDKARLEAAYAPDRPMLVVPAFGTGVKDDCVSMGVLAANIDADQRSVFTQIAFNRAYDPNSNPIEVDKALMADWVADNNDPREFIVESGKYVTFPYFIKIRDMKPGVPPVPGTYEFEITTWTKIGGVKKEIGKKPASVKVTG